MLTVLITIIQLIFAVFFFYLCIAFLTGAPFVPSTNRVADVMIRLANIRKRSVVYDLGSGDGKLLFLAARRGARATGFEINPFLVLFTNIKILLSPYRASISCVWKDFWQTDLSDADVVFVYLLPWKMDKLRTMLTNICRPGTLIVSNSFIFPKWRILRQDIHSHVYVFEIPKRNS